MQISQIIENLKQLPKVEITEAIQDSITKIQEICETQYSNRSFYGHTALNRMILKDKEIAKLLTPEVIGYIFTSEDNLKLIRDGKSGPVTLRSAMENALGEGLASLKYMTCNEQDMSPEMYQSKKEGFKTTFANICAAAGVDEKDVEKAEEPTVDGLVERFEKIAATVELVKNAGKANTLLNVPDYTTDSMRRQTRSGFQRLCTEIDVANTKDITLQDLAKKFLASDKAMLQGWVIHGFYDRAHIEAGLEQDTKFKFKDGDKTLTDIYRAMVTEVAQNPTVYSQMATEQFWIRMKLVEVDLQKRFNEEWQAAVDQMNKLKTAVDAYLNFLENKKSAGDISEKLQNRINAMNTLKENISDAPEQTAEVIKTALKTCAENQSAWSEKPFLDKILDILTLGILPLIRQLSGTEEDRWIRTISERQNAAPAKLEL